MKHDARKTIAMAVYKALLLQGVNKMGEWELTENKKGIIDPGNKTFIFK